MLRGTGVLQKRLKSTQKSGTGSPMERNRFAHEYNRRQIRYGNQGWGMSTYHPRKVRTPPIKDLSDIFARKVTEVDPIMSANTALSAHWRPFALEDGGVLFTHPSHKQIMTWTQEVLKRESEERNGGEMTTFDQHTNSRVQAIIADKTLENSALDDWRKKHLWKLVQAKAFGEGRHRLSGSVYDSIRQSVLQNPRRNASRDPDARQ